MHHFQVSRYFSDIPSGLDSGAIGVKLCFVLINSLSRRSEAKNEEVASPLWTILRELRPSLYRSDFSPRSQSVPDSHLDTDQGSYLPSGLLDGDTFVIVGVRAFTHDTWAVQRFLFLGRIAEIPQLLRPQPFGDREQLLMNLAGYISLDTFVLEHQLVICNEPVWAQIFIPLCIHSDDPITIVGIVVFESQSERLVGGSTSSSPLLPMDVISDENGGSLSILADADDFAQREHKILQFRVQILIPLSRRTRRMFG